MFLTAAEIVAAAGGEVAAGDPGARATSFSIDSRGLEQGACFVALRGHRDGHDFVAPAFAAGASVALVSRIPSDLQLGPLQAVVRVGDTMTALTSLARHAREHALDAVTVVGITGSTGKTSTKDLTAAALGRVRSVHANPDSFNNEIGLPLTLLGAAPHTDVVVTEMGARFAGNIAELCEIARPSIGIVTNIGLAHAEHLGGPDGVLAVKGELVEALPADGLCVLNADDPATPALAARSAAPLLRAGLATGADVRVRDARLDGQLRATLTIDSPWGSFDVALRVRGEHQVTNASLAIAVALATGVAPDDVALGLADAVGSRWRMQLERSPADIVVLNDSYNANPMSMEAALRSLARLEVPGRRFAVLGEMRELGSHAQDAHAAIGRLAANLGVDAVVAVGEVRSLAIEAERRGVKVLPARDAGEALEAIARLVEPGDAVLVKASRAVGLERVAAGLVGGGADPVPGTSRGEAP